MKLVRRVGIGFINKLPSSLKWSLYYLSFFKKRLRIDFTKTRNSLLSKKSAILVIGANDGLSFDDLFGSLNSSLTTGLLLEPSSKYFSQLVKNAAHLLNLIPLKIALSSSNSSLNLYQLNEKGLKKMPEWGRGLGSFSKEHLLKYDGVSEEDIESELVEGRSFNSLIEEYNFFAIEYLQIDTEGFDAEIIKMIDFKSFSSKLIKFEVSNINYQEILETKEILKNQNYYLIRQGGDMIAYSKNINPIFY
ncbi:FkbM family methyltransferase [Algoriphagus iocasae]|uniref:FkbM family methyltransferase n=1 Tax=Algoriphagus iocasae TaxID=1836499 RepID=A0A841MYV4_9BACT|nr:FkbM family methyltransferase [Algoriphagus iocasae]MBB6327818.1 FkbM family methyltransferase [Algoriphagus iocasae]